MWVFYMKWCTWTASLPHLTKLEAQGALQNHFRPMFLQSDCRDTAPVGTDWVQVLHFSWNTTPDLEPVSQRKTTQPCLFPPPRTIAWLTNCVVLCKIARDHNCLSNAVMLQLTRNDSSLWHIHIIIQVFLPAATGDTWMKDENKDCIVYEDMKAFVQVN